MMGSSSIIRSKLWMLLMLWLLSALTEGRREVVIQTVGVPELSLTFAAGDDYESVARLFTR